jgi:hypothetical protein
MVFFFVVIQCDNGHIVCSTCCPKLRNKCQKCSLHISSKRCKAIENLLQSIEMPCPNAKHGCREKMSYTGNRKHEEECIYVPCYCPLSGCDFVAASELLSNHFSHKHGGSQIKFSYGLCSNFFFLMVTPSLSPWSLMVEPLFFKRKMTANYLFSIMLLWVWEMQSIFAALVLTLLGPSIVMIYWLSLRYANWNYSLLRRTSNSLL